MDTLILWFFKANIAFVALYLFYRLFLHRDTFFREKRFAFIFGFFFAVLYPLIDVSSWIQNSQPAIAIAQRMSNTLPEITVTAIQKESFSTEDMLLTIYLIVVALAFIRILWQVASVLVLAHHGQREKKNGLTIIHPPKGSAPFSFFGWIFINPYEHSTRDLEEILHHEKAHARQLHTLDVLFSELVCMIFWINPFAWLLKHHLRANLEYLADMNVIHSGFDAKSYQYHLLRLSYQQSSTKVGNNFNVSQLKNRIIMMNKKKSSLAGLSKYALSLPLFVLLFLAAYAWGAKQDIVSLNDIASISARSAENPGVYSQTVEQNKAIQTSETSDKDEILVVTYNEQNATEAPQIDENTPEAVVGEPEEKPLYGVEQMPQYPGGEKALMLFIGQNLRYPKSAADGKIEGRVTVRFVVGKTGEVSDIVIIRGLDPACDNEALRVVKMMPRWIPGRQDGKAVPVYFTLPILYRLQKDKAVETKQPLLIVDGVIEPYYYLSDITKLKPLDIENIHVVKDSKTLKTYERYGERVKNGVVIVKTKPRESKVTISVQDSVICL